MHSVAAVVAYYPYLSLARPWSVDVPALVLCSAQDTTAPCDRFETLLAEVPVRDRVKIVKYAEGYHAFDNSDLPAKTESPSGKLLVTTKRQPPLHGSKLKNSFVANGWHESNTPALEDAFRSALVD